MAQQHDEFAFPDLGRNGEVLDTAPGDDMVDGGVGAARVSASSLPDTSGVGGILHQVNFFPHSLTPPPAPGKKKKGGRRGTRKNVPWKGWSKEKPSTAQRTKMMRKCGKKCFLGPKKSFPVCKKNTCKVSSKGLWAAYVRAKEWGKKSSSYKGKARPSMKRGVYSRVSRKSKKMLEHRGFKVGERKTRKHKRK